jgi:hypothetical protein
MEIKEERKRREKRKRWQKGSTLRCSLPCSQAAAEPVERGASVHELVGPEQTIISPSSLRLSTKAG